MFKGRSLPPRRGAPRLRRAPAPLRDAEIADRFLVIESCHSTWLFDAVDRRFCRVLKGLGRGVATEWRHYDRLLLDDDSDAFVVFLDAAGTRLVRSWRHTEHCQECGGDVTAELSLAELRHVADARA